MQIFGLCARSGTFHSSQTSSTSANALRFAKQEGQVDRQTNALISEAGPQRKGQRCAKAVFKAVHTEVGDRTEIAKQKLHALKQLLKGCSADERPRCQARSTI